MKLCTKFTVVFRNATLVFTSEDERFRNRLDVYNYVCANRLAKENGKLVTIKESAYCR